MRVFLILAAAVAVCTADLGYIENFQQTARGDDFITLEWNFVSGDELFPLVKYTVLTDTDSSNDVRCLASHCGYTANYLEACQEHTFVLIPYFEDTAAGGTVEGIRATTSGFTNDDPPSAASNLRIVSEDDTGTTLQWDAPDTNPHCVKYYEVCVRLDETTDTICENVDFTTVWLATLLACGKYHVKVTPVTPTGAHGPVLEQTIVTMDGIPGPPQDVVVGLITNTTVELKWNDPAVNPLCAVDYAIRYGPVITRASLISSRAEETYDHHATLSPLAGCTNFSISIFSVNKASLMSEPVTRYAATKETEPLPVPYIVLDPESIDSINAQWGKDETDNCAGFFVICWNDGIHPFDTCENVTDEKGFTITDLLPCTEYEVTITVVSAGGITSDIVSNSTSTLDVKPSPVENLKVAEVYKNEITITFEPPEINTQCIKGYDMQVYDLDQSIQASRRTAVPIEDFITGLEACTNYLIMVSVISPTGLFSAWQETHDRTLDAIPSEPREFGVNAVTTSSISLQWYQADTNGRCASEYILTWHDSTNSTVGNETITDLNFKVYYTVDDLVACETYTFSLIGKSSVGQSNPAEFTYQTLCS